MKCNICNGTEFQPGPGNRMSRSGLPPLCIKCRSTERHRVGRALVDKIRIRDEFSRFSLMIWGETGSVAKGWFKSTEVLASKNSEDELAEKLNESFGFILAANILQSVRDIRLTILNLFRILDQNGLILISYPNPLARERTEDWGEADPKRGGAYRIFGRDFETVYNEIVPESILLRIREIDPVTGDDDILYLGMKSTHWLHRISELNLDSWILD